MKKKLGDARFDSVHSQWMHPIIHLNPLGSCEVTCSKSVCKDNKCSWKLGICINNYITVRARSDRKLCFCRGLILVY